MTSRLGGMRIIALPLTTRVTSSSRTSSPLNLTYYHFQTPPKQGQDKDNQSLVKKVTTKAAQTWAGFGKAPEGNWKRKLFVYGEKLADRIDFEELSLKGVDPSLGPRIGQLRPKNAEKDSSLVQIPLLYPSSGSLEHVSSPLGHIRTLLSTRIPHHKKGFYVWLGIAPLTAPLALIPVVPNLPFFYSAWRSWSHYRAWKASEYLEGLLKSNHVVAQPSAELDEVYTAYQTTSPFPSRPSVVMKSGHSAESETVRPDFPTDSSPRPRPRLLLSQDAIPRILELFNLPESAGTDILRAMEQAKVRIERDAGS